METDEPLDAGPFSEWLAHMRLVLSGDGEAAVPCGACTGCCTSSQFVHIEPDEVDALAHIPSALLFPAPRMPHGHVLLGYDGEGRCPMLGEHGCTIYEHRPRTCRTYDCRIFPAAGVEVTESVQVAIGRRVRRWHFDHPTERDRQEHEAVRAAAADDTTSTSATERAVKAVRAAAP